VDTRTVVVVAGLPGTGKSTMADRFVRVARVSGLRGGRLLGALAPYGILDGVQRPILLASYCDLTLS